MNKAQLQPGVHVFCPAGFGLIQNVADPSDPRGDVQVLIMSDQAPFAMMLPADQVLICQDDHDHHSVDIDALAADEASSSSLPDQSPDSSPERIILAVS